MDDGERDTMGLNCAKKLPLCTCYIAPSCEFDGEKLLRRERCFETEHSIGSLNRLIKIGHVEWKY